MCKHRHSVCLKIAEDGKKHGVAAAILNNYYDKMWCIYLGKENLKHKQYGGQYNVCAGGMEPQDEGCYIKAVMREMGEEFKIELDWPKFDKMFKNQNGAIRLIFHNRTPVFIGVVQGLKRKDLNDKISQCNANKYLHHSLREMDCVDLFELATQKQIEGKVCTVSSFASAIMTKINVTKL